MGRVWVGSALTYAWVDLFLKSTRVSKQAGNNFNLFRNGSGLGSALPSPKSSPCPSVTFDAIVLKTQQPVDFVWIRCAASRGNGQRRRRPSLPPPRRILHSGPFLLDRCHAAATCLLIPTSLRLFYPLPSPHTPMVTGGGESWSRSTASSTPVARPRLPPQTSRSLCGLRKFVVGVFV